MSKKIILGGTFKKDYFINKEKTFEFFDKCLEHGIDHVDLGYGYGGAPLKSSKLIGEYNDTHDKKFEVNDKMPLWRNVFEEYKFDMEKIFYDQLNAAQVDHFDAYMFHCPYDDNSIKEAEWEQVYKFMKGLKEKGLVNKIGVSAHCTKEQAFYLLNLFDLDSAMFSYNILNTSKDWEEEARNEWPTPGAEGFKFAKNKNMETFCMQPLASGRIKKISTEDIFTEFSLTLFKSNIF